MILLGATGYTGRLTAAAMVRAGLAPVLAGRNAEGLAALADTLAPDTPAGTAGPTVAVADVADPASVRRLLEGPDDVLVSTVGPFVRLGAAAVEAAIDAGAAYVDSTGEPPFIAEVFGEYGARAEETGARLLTAFGYDYVPGNLAGALAVTRARESGAPAAKVDVGYFTTGTLGISEGTRASAAGILTSRSFAFRNGTVLGERPGARVRSFVIDERRTWDGLSVGGTEHFTLPRLDASLTEVGVYLGWAGRFTRLASLGGAGLDLTTRVPLLGNGVRALTRRVAGESGGTGPSAAERARGGTLVVAEAFDGVGRPVSAVRVEGPSPYDLTADLLAWAAAMFRVRAERAVGALGPVDAFGLEAFVAGCADAGLAAVD